jgi:hypothetical protein
MSQALLCIRPSIKRFVHHEDLHFLFRRSLFVFRIRFSCLGGLLARTKPCSDGTTATSPTDTLASNFIVQRSDQQSWCPAPICSTSTKYDTKPGSNCLHCICVTTSGAPIGNFAGFGFSQQFTECSSSTVGALANQSII